MLSFARKPRSQLGCTASQEYCLFGVDLCSSFGLQTTYFSISPKAICFGDFSRTVTFVPICTRWDLTLFTPVPLQSLLTLSGYIMQWERKLNKPLTEYGPRDLHVLPPLYLVSKVPITNQPNGTNLHPWEPFWIYNILVPKWYIIITLLNQEKRGIFSRLSYCFIKCL